MKSLILVIDTEDWIDDVSYEQDIEDLYRFVDEWDKIHCRKVMIPGNSPYDNLLCGLEGE